LSDLIKDCRRAAKVLQEKGSFFTAQSILEDAAAEIERCHARLEIDHCFVMGAEKEELVRKDIPYPERLNTPDAVECRDATISLLEDDLKEQGDA